ncbi:hypothetical protein JG687_00014979 [Phytophthora cactorum]|uniref:Uncharacterized protein n=1 Tax=Phytophthora cactorum TaxID=29920 RepID=A0A8T1U045_9STRA|nr:hypothetical protein JG687_00014979 [Phytophthora cactorum]
MEEFEEALAAEPKFLSKREFKLVVAADCATTNRSCRFPDRNHTKITGRCNVASCSFIMRGRLDVIGRVKVSSSVLRHQCQPRDHGNAPTVLAHAVACGFM